MCPLKGCWITCTLLCLGWGLVASALLWQTWNKVVAVLTKMKPVVFWQALLVVATVCVFCAPRMMKGCRHSSCYGNHSCHHGDCGKKGDCPYSRSDEDKEKSKK